MSGDGSEASAFVPGHITGFFSAHPHDDPALAGSRGAGLTLDDGVAVRVRPAGDRDAGEGTVTLDGERTSVRPVSLVLESLGVRAAVAVESDLPVGTGFGVSGAMALGTALAANQAFDCGRSENELVAIAHRAEVVAGTGLGDVVAQARGGIPIRLEPGDPEHNRLDGIPTTARVEYLTFGPISTSAVLSGETDPITRAGRRALAALVDRPTLPSLMRHSREFAVDSGLCTERVATVLEAVEDEGGIASMAMLGETVFALGTDLSDAGFEVSACRTHPAGATVRVPDGA